MPRLLDVRTGRVETVKGHRTAYGKSPRVGCVIVHSLGLEADEVGDLLHHGGRDKAVYVYPALNYPKWLADRPEHADKLIPGGFGENLLWNEVDESTVCIGDRWRVGSALLEICQPRQPCATMARWFDDPMMVKAMVRNGRSGWYCRVVEEGSLKCGDEVRLEHRPEAAWTIAAVLAASYRKPIVRDELRALARTASLAEAWAGWARETAEAAHPLPRKS